MSTMIIEAMQGRISSGIIKRLVIKLLHSLSTSESGQKNTLCGYGFKEAYAPQSISLELRG